MSLIGIYRKIYRSKKSVQLMRGNASNSSSAETPALDNAASNDNEQLTDE